MGFFFTGDRGFESTSLQRGVHCEPDSLRFMVDRGLLATPAKFSPKKCPECLSDVPIAARRCAFCTSPLIEATAR
jgi:hypothetical protein